MGTLGPAIAPPFDIELAASLRVLRDTVPPTIRRDMIGDLRAPIDAHMVDSTLAARGLQRRDVTIPGYGGASIVVSLISAPERKSGGPVFVHFHSGGMIMGNRFDGIDQYSEWAADLHGVLVSVEYRLAPENPDPIPVEDCYAALSWTVENSAELSVDMNQLFVVGASAGGGLAAGVALLARDRNGPRVAGLLLSYPMLDDRGTSVSSTQFEGVGVWDRVSNETGWTALLGGRRGTGDVSVYSAPARATDLRRLPPMYIEVGSAEVFRDECLEFASHVWADGGVAELHVWPGAFHACDLLAPEAAISLQMRDARDTWLSRLLLSSRLPAA